MNIARLITDYFFNVAACGIQKPIIICIALTRLLLLAIQLDTFESEIESLLAGKKKRLDKDKQDRMDELKTKLDKHRYHIRKLETLLRMHDNMSVETDTVSF